MYPNNPQQPGQPQQGPVPTPPQPQQPVPPQGYQGQPAQPQQGYAPTQPADPWQLQQPAQQLQQQPTVVPQQQSRGATYNEPVAPLTPDGIAPIDYLNQIAPQQKASFGFSRKQVALFGGLILLGFLAFAIATILQGSKPNIGAVSHQVTTRIGATTTIARESQQHLRSRELDSLNSSFAIQLANSGTGLTEAFANAGIGVGDARNAVDDDTSGDTKEKLEEARLNGIFDRVYAREMSYRLTTIMLQLDSIHQTTDNAELKQYLEETYKNLEPLQKQFEAYSATTSWQPQLLSYKIIT